MLINRLAADPVLPIDDCRGRHLTGGRRVFGNLILGLLQGIQGKVG